MERTVLKIEGMTCGNCSKKVGDALSAVENVKEVSVDLRKGTATVMHDPVKEEDLIRAVLDAGFRSKVKRGFF
ncbi:MAG: heavy-metal-associated domain-containing protein [Methanomassiliicoccaceae archaeon]|nr:heavy-metal-associated domain-containing protein [Methanomassiliicoccaceae archaeon]